MELLMAELPTPPPSDYSAPSSPRRPLLPSASDSDFDFDFDFSRHLPPNPTLPAADELFDGGVIRPLHPHPSLITPKPAPKPIYPQEPDPKPAPRHHHRVSKSFSPLRVSEFALHQSSSSSSLSSSSSSSPSKWRLKDFLLFRSASEGRARTTKIADPLKKSSSVSTALFACIGSSFDNDSSFRYAIGEGEGSSRRQLRYYRAGDDEEEVKKNKTMSLQYKQRLLDCMGLKSSSSCSSDHQQLSRGLGHCFSL